MYCLYSLNSLGFWPNWGNSLQPLHKFKMLGCSFCIWVAPDVHHSFNKHRVAFTNIWDPYTANTYIVLTLVKKHIFTITLRVYFVSILYLKSAPGVPWLGSLLGFLIPVSYSSTLFGCPIWVPYSGFLFGFLIGFLIWVLYLGSLLSFIIQVLYLDSSFRFLFQVFFIREFLIWFLIRFLYFTVVKVIEYYELFSGWWGIWIPVRTMTQKFRMCIDMFA